MAPHEPPTPPRPSRPFPHQAAFNLDTKPTSDPAGVALPPTLVVGALRELRDLTAVYLDRFKQPDAPRGQTVGVRGAHGSGKTHALGHLMRQIGNGAISRGSAVQDVLALYAKVEGADLASLYRTFMPQISIERLRTIASRFMAEIAGESIAATGIPDDPAAIAAIRAQMTEDPQLVGTLVSEYFLDAGDIQLRRDKEIDRVTGGMDDFRHAFPYLFTDLGDIAYDWLVGRAVEPARLRGIGVSSPISTAKQAKAAFQLLAALCGRGGTALILVIDQLEKLILGPDNELLPESSGMLHSLVETVPAEDGMLVVAGNQQSWNTAPLDLRQRFGVRVVDAQPLELAETAALIRLYLHPQAVAVVDHLIPPDDFEPFTIDAIDLVHRYSGGRPRRSLELCALAWERRDHNAPIGPALVRAAAKQGGVKPIEPHAVLNRVRRLAYEHGFQVRDIVENGSPALILSLADADRVLVLLGLSYHYYDEVVNARTYEAILERLLNTAPQMRAAVLALGYETAEVRDALDRAGVRVLVAAAEDFDGALVKFLREAAAVVHSAPDARLEETTAKLEVLSSTLEQLRTEREDSLRGLTVNVASLDRQRAEEQLAARWQKAGSDWMVERRSVVEQIAQTRIQRRSAELEELERLRQHAERERHRRARLVWLLLALVAGSIAAGTVLINQDSYDATNIGFSLIYVGLVLLMTLWFVGLRVLNRSGVWGLRDLMMRDRLQRELAAPTTSHDDLRRLAHRAAAAGPVRSALLAHANPQIRYVAAFVPAGELGYLAEAIAGERSGLVRRAFAQRIAEASDELDDCIDRLRSAAVPEVAYLVEARCRRSRSDDVNAIGSMEEALAAMYSHRDLAPGARMLAMALAPNEPARIERLSRALNSALPFATRAELVKIPTEIVRAATRSSSPFEQPGLGTFDELRIIDEVDRAYLGLSHLLFLWESGLLVEVE